MKKKILLMLFPLLAMSLTACDKGNTDPDPAPVEKVVDSLTVKTQPTKTTYNAGESFDGSGMVLTVNYVGGTSEDITSGWTVNPAGALNASDTKVTVSYGGKSVEVGITVNGDTPTPATGMKAAYEAAEKLTSGETEPFEFGGVVVGKRAQTNEYFIQDGAYGIDIFQPSEADAPKLVLGKKVKVTSTLQNFNGLIETKTISSIAEDGDGTMPQPAAISSGAELDALKTNVLVNASVVVSQAPTYDASKDLKLTVVLGSDETTLFIKKADVATHEEFIKSLTEGCTINVTNAVVGCYKTKQIVVLDDTQLEKGSGPVQPVLTLDKTTATVEVEKTVTVTATVLNTDDPVVWSLEGDAASLSYEGKVATVTGVSEGTATLKAAVAGLEKTCVVTVTPKGTQTDYGTEDSPISISAAVAILEKECVNDGDMTKQAITAIGEVKEIKNTFSYETGPCFEMYMTDGSSDAYLYRCHATEAQAANIIVGSTVKFVGYAKNFKGTKEFVDNGNDKCHVLSATATDEPVLTLDKSSLNVDLGKTGKITATVLNTEETVVWSSSAEAVATVDQDGTVHGISEGSAVITASLPIAGLSKTCAVTVKDKPAPAEVNVEYEIKTGESADATADISATDLLAIFDASLTTGENVISSASGISKVYKGKDDQLKFSSSKANGTVTLGLSKNVTAVVLSVIAIDDNAAISVNGSEEAITKEYAEYSFTVSSTNSITIAATKRCYINYIGLAAEGVVPPEPHVEKVELNKTTLNLQPDGSEKLVATVTVVGDKAKTVNWSVEGADPAGCVTVDTDGTVHAVAVGTANVIATSTEDSTKKATCAVSVTEAPTDVLTKIEAKEYTGTAEYGSTYSFDGKVYGTYSLSGEKEITSGWSVTTDIDTSKSGEQTGVITYSGVEPAMTCEFKVTVSEPVEKADYNYTATSQTAFTDDDMSGATITVADSTGYEADRGVAWNKKAGTITISDLGSALIKKVVLDVSHNKTTNPSVSVSVGGNAFGDPFTIGKENHVTAEFTSSAASGNVVISVPATTDGSVWVKSIGLFIDAADPAVNSVTVTPESATIEVEETTQLAAVVDAVGGAKDTVTWSSSDESIATVDKDGLVTAVAQGTATITATSDFDDKKSDTCAITVEPKSAPEIVSVSVDPESDDIYVGDTVQLVPTVEVKGGAAQTVTYSSDDEDVATVNDSGLVTGIGDGTAHITVASTVNPDKKAVATITVSTKTAEHGTTEDDPLSTDEAYALAESLGSGGATTEEYYVEGYVTKIETAYSSQFGNITLQFTTSAGKVFKLYRATCTAEEANKIEVGTYVEVHGIIKNYSGTMETDAGAAIVKIENKLAKLEISGDEQLQIEDTATYTVTGFPVSADLGTVTWSIDSGADYISLPETKTGTSIEVTGVAEGTAVIKATSGSVSATFEIEVTADAPVEEVVYKAGTFTRESFNKGSTDYASGSFTSTTAQKDGSNFVVSFDKAANNNKGWDCAAFGSKNADVVSTMSVDKMDVALSSITMSFDLFDGSNVNSVIVYGSSDGSTWTEVGALNSKDFGTGDKKVELSKTTVNMSYKVEFSIKKSSNARIKITAATFNYFAA